MRPEFLVKRSNLDFSIAPVQYITQFHMPFLYLFLLVPRKLFLNFTWKYSLTTIQRKELHLTISKINLVSFTKKKLISLHNRFVIIKQDKSLWNSINLPIYMGDCVSVKSLIVYITLKPFMFSGEKVISICIASNKHYNQMFY